MALSFAGLGFTFSAKDEGVSGVLNKIASGFGLVGKAVGGVLGAIDPRNMMAAADAVAAASKAGENLTTSHEQALLSLGITAQKALVQAGLSGKEMGQLRSRIVSLTMATGYNEAAVSQGVIANKLYTDTLKEFGLKSDDAAVRMEEMGTSAFELGRHLDYLKSRDASADLKRLSGSMTALGNNTHDLNAAYKQTADLVNLVNTRMAYSNNTTLKAGQAMQTLVDAQLNLATHTKMPKENIIGSVNEIENALQRVLGNFDSLAAGLEKDLADPTKELVLFGGNVTEMMAAAQEGPDAFLKSFAKFAKQAQKDGVSAGDAMSFFKTRFGNAFGGETLKLLGHFASASETELDSIIKGVGNVSASLDAAVNAATPRNKTLQAQLDLIRNLFITSFRDISRGAAEEFVHKAGKSYKEFADNIKALADSDGPLSDLVKKMSLAHQVGTKAFLPEFLMPAIDAFGTLAQEMKPALDGLNSLTQLHPVLGVVGGLGLLVTSLALGMKAAEEGAVKLNKSSLNSIAGYKQLKDTAALQQKNMAQLKAQGKEGTDVFTNLAVKYKETMFDIAEKEKAVRTKAADAFVRDQRENFKTTVNFYIDAVDKGIAVLNDMGPEIGKAFDAIDWERLLIGVQKVLKTAWDQVFGKFFTSLWSGVLGKSATDQSALSQIGLKIGEGLRTGFQAAYAFIMPYITTIMDTMKEGIYQLLADIMPGSAGEGFAVKAKELRTKLNEGSVFDENESNVSKQLRAAYKQRTELAQESTDPSIGTALASFVNPNANSGVNPKLEARIADLERQDHERFVRDEQAAADARRNSPGGGNASYSPMASMNAMITIMPGAIVGNTVDPSKIKATIVSEPVNTNR